ncbi:3-oxoadipate enol-lactonase [Chelatococcus reniformis]|uniref:3-oxoadipate enol-lactonase n=1 Tax=Chelatococcus reniformis TaxID=1494448 RepID=A0A916USM2_9HYPH|nr:3-oxoadipate enol-lactonase [Chelatococcus reniformis]GGC84736.1 3-oxoadipate enol-lactonase [Chelatococcus reniformis]
MSMIETAAGRFHVSSDGPHTAPALVMAHSVAAGLTMWEPQVAALAQHFRVIRYDARGHGGSVGPARPFGIDQLGRDALSLLDALHIDRAHWCGLSMGGMVGQWLLAHAGDRLARVALANTAAVAGQPDGLNERIRLVRQAGMTAVADATMARWFTPGFRAAHPAVVDRIRALVLATPPHGFTACSGALRDMDLRAAIAGARNPVLVIVGSQDPGTPPAAGRLIARRIAGARVVELDAAHLSNVEQADAFTRALLKFLLG